DGGVGQAADRGRQPHRQLRLPHDAATHPTTALTTTTPLSAPPAARVSEGRWTSARLRSVEPRSPHDAPAGATAAPAARLAALVHTAWPIRVVGAVHPLLLGPALGDALDDAGRGVQAVASVGAWLVWLAVLVATLVPTTVSLTALRLAAPGAAV